MLIINNKETVFRHPVMNYLPSKFKKLLNFATIGDAEEIRLRRGLPLIINFSDKQCFITSGGILSDNLKQAVIANDYDIREALELIVKSSLYTAENSLKNGFVTVEGGNRIGICGSAVICDNKISSIKNISGFNYRIAKDIRGVSDKIINNIYRNGQVRNTLIISPPGCGKTTILRDIARNLSNKGIKICIADERNEISALSYGKLGFDLGYSLDVLEGASKSDAFKILIRSMSPDVIITDELGGNEDLCAVKKAVHSGVGVIASVHSSSREDFLKNNPEFIGIFNCFITLNRSNGPGTVGEIYCV